MIQVSGLEWKKSFTCTHNLIHPGADYNQGYKPVPTSYDYDAPLTEAGDPTNKLHAIRSVIGKVTAQKFFCFGVSG